MIVAGHICLDIIPEIPKREWAIDGLLQPGKLVVVGPATMATGGCVSNTGIALNKLGLPTLLVGKVGDDLLGKAVLDILCHYGQEFTEGMIVTKGETTSYSIVISPPGIDRMFFHCAGANDTFGAEDLDFTRVGDPRLFHFGYPPIMKRMYLDGGKELVTLFEKARRSGLTTSLDMSMPDPASEAGSVDWRRLLRNVLPYVDIFLPSLEETLFMLDRQLFSRLQAKGGEKLSLALTDGSLLARLAEEPIEMGAAVVGLKLGDNGLYLRTSSDRARIAAMGRSKPRNPEVWAGRELLAPCFDVDVVGTTGAGDSTIAGFLSGFMFGLQPEKVIASAVGVGAFDVERADATSGIPSWKEVQARLSGYWGKRPISFGLPSWTWNERDQIWTGPHDSFR